MRKVLIIAYAFPPMPFAGVYRTLRFCKYLLDHGWQPVILTVREQRSLPCDDALMASLPAGVKVYRTPTIDPYRIYQSLLLLAKKKLGRSSEKGTARVSSTARKPETKQLRNLLRACRDHLLELITTPDHMVFWIPFALVGGIRAILKEDIDVVYTSTPPHSSQMIGLILSRLFRKPCVADFRDPWGENAAAAMTWRSRGRKWIESLWEKAVVKGVDRVLVSSRMNQVSLAKRFAGICDPGKIVTLTNGYDPEDFTEEIKKDNSIFEIVHVGSLYLFQSPEPFLRGLKTWLDTLPEHDQARVRVTFAGPKSALAEELVQKLDLKATVQQIGIVPHKEAIIRMRKAHLLLLILGFNKGTNGILPSKTFEYLAAERPILAIAPQGEMVSIIRETDTGIVVTSENETIVASGIDKAYTMVRGGLFQPDARMITQYDGRLLTRRLAGIFNELCDGTLKTLKTSPSTFGAMQGGNIE